MLKRLTVCVTYLVERVLFNLGISIRQFYTVLDQTWGTMDLSSFMLTFGNWVGVVILGEYLRLAIVMNKVEQ